MTDRYTEFLVSLNGKSPRNLRDSIRRVSMTSAGFVQSWSNGDQQEAFDTSQEAFEHLDYIQSELLRQRDVHRVNAATWAASPFKASLSSIVGSILKNLTAAQRAWFLNLPQGSGAMPATVASTNLTLETALNKLKHRDTVAFNFSASTNTGHVVYMVTNAGLNKTDSLSQLSISSFCAACKVAAAHV